MLELTARMHHAVLMNDVDDVSWVTGQAPEILSRCDQVGRNWFHTAAIGESVQVIDWLALHGAVVDINGRDSFGRTPLWVIPRENPSAKVFSALLRAGADPDVLYKQESLLNSILRDGWDHVCLPIVQCLLECGANPNLADSMGHTPLHSAVDRYHAKYVKMLLAAGADPTLMNQDSEDAIDLAKRKMPEVVDQLQAWAHARQAHKAVIEVSNDFPGQLVKSL